MEIHERFAALIEDNDTNETILANEINVNRKQITRWKQGQAEMGIYKLKQICEYFNVSADYILGLPRGLNWPRG